MRHLMGLVVAGGLWLGMAEKSDAQFSLSIGNGGYGTSYYSSGYNGYVSGAGVIGATNYGGYPGYAPVYSPGYSYSSGYAGYAPGYAAYAPNYVGYAPAYRNYAVGSSARYNGSYGYGNYGYGSRGGFRPFGGIGRRYR